MRKKGTLFLVIVLMFITACSTNEKKEVTSQSQPVQEKIIISKLQKGITLQQYKSQTKKDIIATFNDPSVTEVFINAFKEAEMISGVANVASPKYEVTFQKNGAESSYYLWININDQTSNAMYMTIDDTSTAYKISVEYTNSMNKIFKEIEKQAN
ncbi:hypothetical protein D3C76_356070 [compost metagenome]